MDLAEMFQEYLPQIITLAITVAIIMKQLAPLTELINKLISGKANKEDLGTLYKGIQEIVELEEVRALREIANPVIPQEVKDKYANILNVYKDNKEHLQRELLRLEDRE